MTLFYKELNVLTLFYIPVGKIVKKTLKKCVFVNTVPYCQKYTPTDCLFGEFAHWMLLYICRVDSG